MIIFDSISINKHQHGWFALPRYLTLPHLFLTYNVINKYQVIVLDPRPLAQAISRSLRAIFASYSAPHLTGFWRPAEPDGSRRPG